MNLSWKALGIGALAMAAALLAGSFWLAADSVSAQMPPHVVVLGTVTLDGAAAPAGTNISAIIDGNVCGEAIVGTDDILEVVPSAPSPEFEQPGVAQVGCGDAGDTVTFTVGGCPAGESTTYQNGLWEELDLSAVCAAPTAVPPTAVPPTEVPAVATATPVVVTGTGGYLGGDSGTPSWAYLAGGLSLLLTAAGGLAAYRRYVR
jgi:hypothetical protein